MVFPLNGIVCTSSSNFNFSFKPQYMDSPGGAVVKNLPANAGDAGSIPGLEEPTCRGAAKPVHHNY